jgi:hypothetical protein
MAHARAGPLPSMLEVTMIRTMLRGRTVRSALLASVFLAACGAAGCDLFTTKPEVAPSGKRSSALGASSGDACDQLPDRPRPAAELPACDGTHQIAVVPPGGICSADGWIGGRLFEGTKGQLASYCRYEWTSEGAPNTAVLPAGASEDCTFVTPQQQPPADFTPWAYEVLLGAAKGTNGAASTPGYVRTRVAVLDTSPTQPGAPIQPGLKSHHGETLARLIQAIACKEPVDCPVEVRTRLVMPWYVERGGSVPAAQRYNEGGNVGRLEDLAMGMWAEIAAYVGELESAAGDPDRAKRTPTQLVFNESFAWGDFNGTDQCNEHPRASTDSVVQALVGVFDAAACVGAVHVAAAGNHTGGLVLSQGLMCPAKWHHEIHPGQERCEALFGKEAFQTIQDHFAGLLKAKGEPARPIWEAKADALLSVGGTAFDLHPIAMTRPNACPEVAALGISGTARRDPATCPAGIGCDPYFPFLFGTSVSTAVVSGNLAASWYAAGPAASPPEAVQRMIEKSQPTTADVNRSGGCGCSGATACKVPWIGAPGGLTPDSQNPQPQPDVRSTVTSLPAQVPAAILLDPVPVCPAKIPLCAAESTSAAPGVWPVPGEPPCTRCTLFLESPGTPQILGLRIDMNPSLTAADIRSATLFVQDANGRVILTTSLPPGAFFPAGNVDNDTSLIRLSVANISLTGAHATISAYNADGGSVSQQIFVIQ